MDLKEFILKIVISSGVIGSFLAIAIRYFLYKKKSNNRWLREKQKTINHLTITLKKFEKEIQDQLSRQWELSYSEYEFTFEEDLVQAIKNHLDELIALSIETGTYGRKLKKEINAFEEFIDDQERIAKKIAKQILLKEKEDEFIYSGEDSQELFQLTQNQRYHEWVMHLTNISHYSSLLAFHLYRYALEKETKIELKSLSGNLFWTERFWRFFKRKYKY